MNNINACQLMNITTNPNFANFIHASLGNGLSNQIGGDAILSGLNAPQPETHTSKYSMDELRKLKKKQQEQEILIDNLTSMISRLVNENEMKNNRIQKLETSIEMLSKVLIDYKNVLDDRVDQVNNMNTISSRQMFDDINHHQQSSDELMFTHSEDRKSNSENFKISRPQDEEFKQSECIEI